MVATLGKRTGHRAINIAYYVPAGGDDIGIRHTHGRLFGEKKRQQTGFSSASIGLAFIVTWPNTADHASMRSVKSRRLDRRRKPSHSLADHGNTVSTHRHGHCWPSTAQYLSSLYPKGNFITTQRFLYI